MSPPLLNLNPYDNAAVTLSSPYRVTSGVTTQGVLVRVVSHNSADDDDEIVVTAAAANPSLITSVTVGSTAFAADFYSGIYRSVVMTAGAGTGSTTVTVTAEDSSHNTSTATYDIRVISPPPPPFPARETLMQNGNDSVMSRLPPSRDAQYVSRFLVHDWDSATYTTNPDLWCAPFDLSGVPAAWSAVKDNPGYLSSGGALITPKHMVCAWHQGFRGQPRFRATDGTIYTRNVVSYVQLLPDDNSAYDVLLLTLDEELPATVHPVKFLADYDWVDAGPFPNTENGCSLGLGFGLWVDQFGKVWPCACSHYGPGVLYPTLYSAACGASLGTDGVLKCAGLSDLVSVRKGQPESGDSGAPGFLVLDNELILWTTVTGQGVGGPAYSTHPALRSALEAAVAPYSLTFKYPVA